MRHLCFTVALIALGSAAHAEPPCAELAPTLARFPACRVLAHVPGRVVVAWDPTPPGVDVPPTEAAQDEAFRIAVTDMVTRAHERYEAIGLNRPVAAFIAANANVASGYVGHVQAADGAKELCTLTIEPSARSAPARFVQQNIFQNVAICAYADWLGVATTTPPAGGLPLGALFTDAGASHAWWRSAWALASSDRMLPTNDYERTRTEREPYSPLNPPTRQSSAQSFAFFAWLLGTRGAQLDAAAPERVFVDVARRLLAAPTDEASQWRAFAATPDLLTLLADFGTAAYRREIFEAGGRPAPLHFFLEKRVGVESPGPTSHTEHVGNGVTTVLVLETPPRLRVHVQLRGSRPDRGVFVQPLALGVPFAKFSPPQDIVYESPCEGPGRMTLLLTGLDPDVNRSATVDYDVTTESIEDHCHDGPNDQMDPCLKGTWTLDRGVFGEYWSQLQSGSTRFGLRSVSGGLTLSVAPDRTMTWTFADLSQRVDAFTSMRSDPVETTVRVNGAVQYRARTSDGPDGKMTKLVIDPIPSSGELTVGARTVVNGVEMDVPLDGLPPFAPSARSAHMHARCTDSALAFIFPVPAGTGLGLSDIYYRFTRQR